MMTLNEELLDKQGVTKGARHKIILSIGKLKERPHQLKQLHDEMTNDKDSVRNALTEIKWMLTTPIKPVSRDEEASNEMISSGGNGNNNPPGPIGSNRFQQQEENNADLINQQRNRETDDDLPGIIVKVIGKGKSHHVHFQTVYCC